MCKQCININQCLCLADSRMIISRINSQYMFLASICCHFFANMSSANRLAIVGRVTLDFRLIFFRKIDRPSDDHWANNASTMTKALKIG